MMTVFSHRHTSKSNSRSDWHERQRSPTSLCIRSRCKGRWKEGGISWQASWQILYRTWCTDQWHVRERISCTQPHWTVCLPLYSAVLTTPPAIAKPRPRFVSLLNTAAIFFWILPTREWCNSRISIHAHTAREQPLTDHTGRVIYRTPPDTSAEKNWSKRYIKAMTTTNKIY